MVALLDIPLIKHIGSIPERNRLRQTLSTHYNQLQRMHMVLPEPHTSRWLNCRIRGLSR